MVEASTLRALRWFQGMPEWFRATCLGGVLVLATIFLLGWMGSASADEVHDLRTRVERCEQDDATIHGALLRIETKLDAVVLRLIPERD